MLDPVTGPLLVMAIAGAATAGGVAAASANQQAKEAKSAREAAERAAANQGIGNLNQDEIDSSISRKMFRQGLYFTSPTGTIGSGTRGRSRLLPGS